MELSCPSCGAKHETNDFPDVFEIQCACGYGIIVPDTDSIEADASFASSPVGEEIEDEHLKVSSEELQEMKTSMEFVKINEDMTPPEDLPREMPYDPFEVPSVDAQEELSVETGVDPFIDLQVNDEFSEETPSQEPAVIASEIKDQEEVKQEAPAQEIIERAQLASMGQLLGFSYNLEWKNISKEDLLRVKNSCLSHIEHRPWLLNELKRRGIDITKIESLEALTNVPEALALELYLGIIEQGGDCRFQQVTFSD